MTRVQLAAGLGIVVVCMLLTTGVPGFLGAAGAYDDAVSRDDGFVEQPYVAEFRGAAGTVVYDEWYSYEPGGVWSELFRGDGGLMDGPWPMKCHDLRHTSRSPYNASDGGGLEKWRFRTGFHVVSSAVIDDQGIIYFGARDYDVRALYPNGSLKWEYETDGIIWSAPALAADGTIYVGSWDCRLHALYPNGTRKWVFGAGEVIASSPAIAPDGTIYFGVEGPGNKGRIWAVNPNGTAKWYYDTGYWIASDPAVGDDGTIYVGSLDNYLYALYPNGSLKWRFKTGDWVKAHPVIADDGTIYISSLDGKLYALHPDNGSVLWTYPWGIDSDSPALGPDGTLYLGNDRVRAIHPNGTIKWEVDVGPDVGHASLTLSADGVLYVPAGNAIVAMNSEDGTELWRKRIANEGVDSSPVLGADGTVYIGSSSSKRNHIDGNHPVGYLHAFGPVSSNSPPETPVIEADPTGEAEEKQLLKFTTVDVDRNPLQILVEWGDGSVENWTMEAASGETIYLVHTWMERGVYTVRCKARDVLGEESGWAEFEIKIQKRIYPDTQGYSPGVRWVAQWFPMFTRLLQLLGI